MGLSLRLVGENRGPCPPSSRSSDGRFALVESFGDTDVTTVKDDNPEAGLAAGAAGAEAVCVEEEATPDDRGAGVPNAEVVEASDIRSEVAGSVETVLDLRCFKDDSSTDGLGDLTVGSIGVNRLISPNGLGDLMAVGSGDAKDASGTAVINGLGDLIE